MLRLIDAEELKEQLKNNYGSEASMSYEASLFRDMIDEQPTVYDLDNVVEQLKQAGFSDEHVPNRVVAIVKAGGVNVDTITEQQEISNLRKLLKKFTDLEEQGLLLILPCKIGTKIYRIYEYTFEKEKKYVVVSDRWSNDVCDYNEWKQGKIFFTREEAEAKAKELRGVR